MTEKNEALRLAGALEDDLEDYAGLSLPRLCQGIADDAAAELRRLHAENKRLQHKLQSKRAIFQAGRDSYETACIPYNTDDEAWKKFTSAIKAVEGEKT